MIIKNVVKRISAGLGFGPSLPPTQFGWDLHQYTKMDGTFDYEKYRAVQIEGNKKKIGLVWACEENIRYISEYLSSHVSPLNFGICHGTRRGKEQEWFRKYLGCEVIGTEISDTAEQFPHTIQQDFHEIKPEWTDACDFIYSNSFDHSYDPEKCLNAWMNCIRPGGICILEHSSDHGRSSSSELDPFGADLIVMPYLMAIWAKGRFAVREIVEAPVKPSYARHNHFIIIQRL